MGLVGQTVWIRAKKLNNGRYVSFHGMEDLIIKYDEDGCIGDSMVKSVFKQSEVTIQGEPDPVIPKAGQLWQNTNGRVLQILFIGKDNSDTAVKFMYHDSDNTKVYEGSKNAFHNYWTYIKDVD